MQAEIQAYSSSINQLALVMEHGPLGIKISNGQFIQKSKWDCLKEHLSLCLSIFTRQNQETLAEIATLLAHQIHKINLFHQEITNNQQECPDCLKTAYKTIYLWNKKFAQSPTNGGLLQPWLLKLSGVERKAFAIHDFYIHFSMPALCPEMPQNLFTCSFSNIEQLPLIISPKNDEIASFEKIHAWLLDNQEIITNLMKEHGAIKFRNFKIETPQDFEEIVKVALNCRPEDYVGGEGARDKIEGAENVYTSTNAPEKYAIDLHQEKSIEKNMPDYISFFCEAPPRLGTGQTTLGRAEKVSEALEKKPLWARFVNQTLSYISRHPPKGHLITKINKSHKTWQDVLAIKESNPTKSREEAEKISQERGITFGWDGKWYVKSQEAPATREHPYQKEKQIWMNQVHFSKLTPKLVGNRFFYWAAKLIYLYPGTWGSDVCFSNGRPVSKQDISEIFDTLREHTTHCNWQKNDLLLVDNRMIMHGRASSNYLEGKRRILTVISSKTSNL